MSSRTFLPLLFSLFVIAQVPLCWAKPVQIKITARNRANFADEPTLREVKIKAACYRISKSEALLGSIKGSYFKYPLKVTVKKSASVARALKIAKNACRPVLLLPTPRTTPRPTRTPSRPKNTPTPRPTFTPTATETATPSPTSIPQPLQPAVPQLAAWESHMLTYGRTHCERLKDTSLSLDSRLAATYYDAQWVFYQIGDYTGDSYWYDCAQSAEVIYRDNYAVPNSGVIPGYWDFSHGLARDYLSTGDQNSKNALIQLSTSASYAPDWTPLSWTEDSTMSREVAYNLMSYLNSELVGAPHRARSEDLVAQALGHCSQWFVSGRAPYIRPFMFSLTAHALISYDAQIGGNPQILPAIIGGANWIWNTTWIPSARAFKYTDRVVESGGTEAAPDLNLLIAPIYAWIWHQTGDVTFRERADQIFEGGVTGAWLANGKQFNQNYRLSFAYLKWRNATPLR